MQSVLPADYDFGPLESKGGLPQAAEAVRLVGKRVLERLPQLVMNSMLYGSFVMLMPLLVLVLVYFTKSSRTRAAAAGICSLLFSLATLQWAFEIYVLVLNVLGSNELRDATAECIMNIVRGAECTLTLSQADQIIGLRAPLLISVASTLVVGNLANMGLACHLSRGNRPVKLIAIALFSATVIVASFSQRVMNDSPAGTIRSTSFFILAVLSWALNLYVVCVITRRTKREVRRHGPAESPRRVLLIMQVLVAALSDVAWTALLAAVCFARFQRFADAFMSSLSWYCARGVYLFVSSGFLYAMGIYITVQFILTALTPDEDHSLHGDIGSNGGQGGGPVSLVTDEPMIKP